MYGFLPDTMTLPPQYAKEIEGCTNKIVEDLVSGKQVLFTPDILEHMSGVRFSEDFTKAVHAMVCRKLLKNGLMLVCYPNIVPPYDPMAIVIEGYVYQAVPIEEKLVYH